MGMAKIKAGEEKVYISRRPKHKSVAFSLEQSTLDLLDEASARTDLKKALIVDQLINMFAEDKAITSKLAKDLPVPSKVLGAFRLHPNTINYLESVANKRGVTKTFIVEYLIKTYAELVEAEEQP